MSLITEHNMIQVYVSLNNETFCEALEILCQGTIFFDVRLISYLNNHLQTEKFNWADSA